MRTVFFDVDTQVDFLLPSGALAVAGAAELIPRIAALNRHAAAHGIPLISTMDAHAENDPEFRAWPAHCVAGTLGQRKPESALLPKRTVLTNGAGALPAELAAQIILEKTRTDCFTNPRLEALLARLGAERAVVYGVVTEICVRYAVEGLQRRGVRVEVVADAVKELSGGDRDAMFERLRAAGGALTETREVLAA